MDLGKQAARQFQSEEEVAVLCGFCDGSTEQETERPGRLHSARVEADLR